MAAPIVCFDLDGTLFDAEGRIHSRDVELLLSERSVRWIPCTGRMLYSVRNTFNRNGLFVDQPIPFPMVLQNGAATYFPMEQLHSFLTFDPQTQDCLIRTARSIPGLASFFSTAGELHVMNATRYADETAARYGFHVQPFDESSLDRRYGKMMCISDQPEPLAEVSEATQSLPIDRAFSMSIIFEVTPLGGNKGSGVKRLLSAMGLAGEPVYVVGDGGNDLTLFEAAAYSFSPITSPLDIQARTDAVIDQREEGLLGPILRRVEGLMRNA